MLASMVMVFAALGEAVATSGLAASDRFAIANRLDRFARWAFPGLYVVVALVCFV